jgi:hypothetical protein
LLEFNGSCEGESAGFAQEKSAIHHFLRKAIFYNGLPAVYQAAGLADSGRLSSKY